MNQTDLFSCLMSDGYTVTHPSRSETAVAVKIDETPTPETRKTVYDLHREALEREVGVIFDGETFDPDQDASRLLTELQRVWAVMLDGRWHDLASLARTVGGSESGVSARLRDFRKPRFGAHVVERQRSTNGLHLYRLVPNGALLTPESR